jgi:hypothetical protein
MKAQWVHFANGESVAGISMATTHYAELARKGLDTYKNHMRVVERRGDSYHHTLAVWHKDKSTRPPTTSGVRGAVTTPT